MKRKPNLKDVHGFYNELVSNGDLSCLLSKHRIPYFFSAVVHLNENESCSVELNSISFKSSYNGKELEELATIVKEISRKYSEYADGILKVKEEKGMLCGVEKLK